MPPGIAAAAAVAAVWGTLRSLRETRSRGRRMHVEYARISRSESLYRAIASSMSEVVTLHEADGTIVFVSPSAQRWTGFGPEAFLGRRPADIVHSDDRDRAWFPDGAQMPSTPLSRGTLRVRCRGGEYRPFEVVTQRFEGGSAGQYIAVSRDVTERLKTDSELQQLHHRYRHLAYHDERTGLPNREGFFAQLNDALDAARKSGLGLSLLAIDIDDFKAINESRGYVAADELLDAFVLRLQMVTHDQCTLARLGGDEFVALVPHNDVDKLEALAGRIVGAFTQPTALRGEMAYLTVSGGTARFPDDGADGEALLKAANIALYAAKKAGKNTWRHYTSELGRLAAQRAVSLQSLLDTFERGEFELHYQPKHSLANGCIVGYEALLRCTAREGVSDTGELIAAAERSGFIVTLGAWVLETAAHQCLAWRGTALERPIAVNVSALQLHDRQFVPLMRKLVERDPFLPSQLVLEITESALFDEFEHAQHSMRELTGMGFAMHIDDFGTGYSSLSRLSRMPVSALKIDRSFVSGTPHGAESCEIVKSIVALAQALKMSVIAEGIETQAQLEFLVACGCDEAQGYLFSRPMAPSALAMRERATSPDRAHEPSSS